MSVVGNPFSKWVNAQIDDRNEKITTSNNLNIDIAPELMEIFKNSTAVSSKIHFFRLNNNMLYNNNLYVFSHEWIRWYVAKG